MDDEQITTGTAFTDGITVYAHWIAESYSALSPDVVPAPDLILETENNEQIVADSEIDNNLNVNTHETETEPEDELKEEDESISESNSVTTQDMDSVPNLVWEPKDNEDEETP